MLDCNVQSVSSFEDFDRSQPSASQPCLNDTPSRLRAVGYRLRLGYRLALQQVVGLHELTSILLTSILLVVPYTMSMDKTIQ